jgi:hypothetical protein
MAMLVFMLVLALLCLLTPVAIFMRESGRDISEEAFLYWLANQTPERIMFLTCLQKSIPLFLLVAAVVWFTEK